MRSGDLLFISYYLSNVPSEAYESSLMKGASNVMEFREHVT